MIMETKYAPADRSSHESLLISNLSLDKITYLNDIFCSLSFILCLLFIHTLAQAQEIVPLPNSYKQSGGLFKVPQTVTISSSDLLFSGLISTFSESVKKYTSY